MASGFPFPGSVSIQPPTASPGAPIRAEVSFADPATAAQVQRVEAEIPEYGYRLPLHASGDRFVLETQVPWEAPPGQYRVFFYAYTADGQASAAREVPVTIA